MRNQFGKIAIGCVLAVAGMPSAAYSQAPAPAAPHGSVVVASPTYTSIAMEITVNRPAAEVWKRIGKYCDVSEWLQKEPLAFRFGFTAIRTSTTASRNAFSAVRIGRT